MLACLPHCIGGIRAGHSRRKRSKIREGQHRAQEYLRVNPWGKIPAMLVDGEVLTEAHAHLGRILVDLAPAGQESYTAG